jgi:hypothetical protein
LRAYKVGEDLKEFGWRVTVVAPQCELVQRRRILRWERPDLVMIQKGRHPLNWPAYYPGQKIVFDIDDADFLDPGQREQVEACCRGSLGVIAGSHYVADWCRQFQPRTEVIWTGSPIPAVRAQPRPKSRRPILTWANSDPAQYPREAELVRAVVERLADKEKFEFWLFGHRRGADNAFTQGFTSLPIPVKLFEYMPYERFLDSLREVAVGLSPQLRSTEYNLGKSFGKVLAYLTSEVAVVASDAADMPKFFRSGETGMLVKEGSTFDETVDRWVESTLPLLRDPARRQAMAEAAYDDFVRDLSTKSSTNKVDRFLRETIDSEQSKDLQAQGGLVL